MANQKTYSIVINGISESVTQVDALIKRLADLEKTIDKMSSATVDTKVDTTSLQEANALQQEIAKSQQLQNDEYQKTLISIEKQKNENKEILQTVKDIANGTKDMDGGYTNTLKGMRKELSDLKKELAGVEVGSDAFNELIKKTNDLNNQVKAVEQSYGVFSRNVGNYGSAVEGLNGLKVTIGGVEASFATAREASKALNTEMTSIASRMRELQESGQGASEEFNTLKQRFEDLAGAEESIDKASAYAERLKTSMQDDSGVIGEVVRGFDELNSIVGIGTGIMGLFGETSEDTQKAINRTVQVMTVMQSVQKLLNKELQNGGVINGIYQTTLGAMSKAFGVTNASSKAASLGVKAFSGALVATGVGAIVVALGLLISNFDELCDWAKEAGVDFDALGKVWDNVKSIAMGVGNVIINWITNPIKTMIEVVKDVANGDFEAAFNAIGDGIKRQYDVVSSYQEGYRKQEKKNQENHAKEMAKQREKDLQNQIDANEAKYGSDWKYTDEARKLYDAMFDARMAQYEADSDEYRKAQNAKVAYDREFTENQQKKVATAKKANADRLKDAQDNAKKLRDVEDKIQDNQIASMKDGYQKKLAELKKQRDRELRDAKEQGIKVAELQKSINDKYNAQIQELNESFWKSASDNIQKALDSMTTDNLDKTIEAIKRKFQQLTDIGEMSLSNSGKGTTPLDIVFGKSAVETLKENLNNAKYYINDFSNYLNKIGTSYSTKQAPLLNEQSIKKAVKEIVEFGDKGKEAGEKLLEGMSGADKEAVNLIRSAKSLFTQLSGTTKDSLNSKGFFNLKKQFESVKYAIDSIIPSLSDDKVKGALKTYAELIDSTISSVVISINQHNERMNDSNYAFWKSISEGSVAQSEQYKKIIKASLDDINNLVDSQMNSQFFGITPTQISDAKKSYETLKGAIHGQIESINEMMRNLNKVPEEYGSKNGVQKYAENLAKVFGDDALDRMKNDADAYKDVYNTLAHVNKDIADDFEKMVSETTGSALVLDSNMETILLDVLKNMRGFESDFLNMNGIRDALKQLDREVDSGMQNLNHNLMERISSIAQTIGPILQDFTDAFTNAFNMAIDNANTALEHEMDEIDDTIDELEEQMDKVSEIYEKHNQRVNDLEAELATARGDRRTELLNEINNEMAQREKAWAQEQKIQKQEEALQKRKEQLQKQEDANELKRKKAQKISSIIQATINTALGVTQALGAYPPPASYVMAAIVGALGAAEIATIASQQFAKGGVIEGKSHAQGGVKVLGGTAEVEGGEYITNRRTTAKNVGVLSFINSQDRALTLKDFEEYFASRGRYSENGLQSKVKFASGGQLASPDMNVRQMTAMFKQDNRPIVVSVVDIIDETDNLRQVQALAGAID